MSNQNYVVGMMQSRKLIGKFHVDEMADLSKRGRYLADELSSQIARNRGFMQEYDPSNNEILIYRRADEDNLSRIMMMENLVKDLRKEIDSTMSLQIDEPEIIIDPVSLAEAVRVSGLQDTVALRTALTIYLSTIIKRKETGVYIRHSTVFKNPALLIKCG